MENTFKGSKDYVASPELMNAVNIAVALKKPLLIKGEPGTGKTMLAQAVSEAMGKKLIIWSVRVMFLQVSSSIARNMVSALQVRRVG